MVNSTKKWILFLFLFIPPTHFFEKFPVKQTIKKCWPDSKIIGQTASQSVLMHTLQNKHREVSFCYVVNRYAKIFVTYFDSFCE